MSPFLSAAAFAMLLSSCGFEVLKSSAKAPHSPVALVVSPSPSPSLTPSPSSAPESVCTESMNEGAPFAGGAGTLESPFQICTVAQLSNVRTFLTSHFIQLANLDLSGATFLPIGQGISDAFRGVYDGNFKTISGYSYACPADGCGLFASGKNFSVKNLGLVNFQFTSTGAGSIGALVGSIQPGTALIERIYSSGSISCSTNNCSSLAGIAGHLGTAQRGGTIRNSHSSVSVTGAFSNSSGLVGFFNGTMENCYASGNVAGGSITAGQHAIGGIIGGSFSGGWYNSFSTGFLSGPLGLVIGDRSGSPPEFNIHEGSPSTFYETSHVVYTGWDFSQVWQANPSGLPTLRGF